MDLGEFKTIEEYFLKLDGSKPHIFPSNENYVTRYAYMSDQFNTKIHPYVQMGAISYDGGYLNDHGPDHIKKVILRASELLKDTSEKLSEYEIYILLMAIHIHDVGNILGRNGHEIRSIDVIKEYGIQAGQDRIEWDCIFEIAEAHGGDIKDKISDLNEDRILDFDVRKPLLAAILKFADELSEDRTRASKLQLMAKQIVPEAEIYHKLSYSLHSVKIDSRAREIKLSFDIEEDDLCKEYDMVRKNGDDNENIKVFLIDQIYKRTYKTFLEKIYCMRFMRPLIQIDKIRVDIVITLNEKDARGKPKKNTIFYELQEVGYPSYHNNGIEDICPELIGATGAIVCEQSKIGGIKDVSSSH
ncbi:HD domain-containing protein [Sphingobacterium chuzhouense]|nr:hypothetical protein [Sphingobacterium chuzhouense]